MVVTKATASAQNTKDFVVMNEDFYMDLGVQMQKQLSFSVRDYLCDPATEKLHPPPPVRILLSCHT
jgi:hypothetical protein